jgi:formate transporter
MPESLILTPKEMNDTLVNIGKKKATMRKREVFMYAILAGLYIALGAIAAAIVLSGGVADTGIAKFAAGVIFSTGLILVVVAGAELFTGNMLMTAGYIEKKYFFAHIIKNWAIVWIGNFVGAMIIVALAWASGYFYADAGMSKLGETLVKITHAKMMLPFWPAFFRGILCNILVCLAVVLSLSSVSTEGKILAIVFPITAFIIGGYEHCVANMFFLPAGLLAECQFKEQWLAMANNLIPVTLGNIVGGVIIVLLHPKSYSRLAKFLKGAPAKKVK